MPTVVMLEALAFGLDHLAEAARRHGTDLVLLTFDRAYYQRQLTACGDRVRVVDVDTFDLRAVRKALDGLGPVQGLIANTDTWAPVAEALAAERGFANVLRDAALLRDKTAVRNRLADAGLTTARAVRGDAWATTPAEQRPAPMIVKDAAGTSSKNVLLAESPAEVDALITVLTTRGVPAERITVEPYACGPLFSAETYTTAGGTTLLGISSRSMSELPEFRELDLTYPVGHGTAWEREIEVWAGEVLRVLDRGTGPSHIEFIRTAGGPELVEVNPRLGGGHIGEAVLRATGVNVYELLLTQALHPLVGQQDLADATRAPEVGGYAQVLKYTRRTGPLGEVTGAEALAAFPGGIGWTQLKDATSVITDVTDQGACYGFLTATGPSPEEALHRALAAARHLRINTTSGMEHGR